MLEECTLELEVLFSKNEIKCLPKYKKRAKIGKLLIYEEEAKDGSMEIT